MVCIHIFASCLLPLQSECHKGEFGGRRGSCLRCSTCLACDAHVCVGGGGAWVRARMCVC